jgi:transposase, IS5 family
MQKMPISQPGFFDLRERYDQLNKSGDPLVKLNEIIPWEDFRASLNKALRKIRKSKAGRPPYDYVLMFKVLVLQSLYNVSDAQIEFQIKDRLSFMRFLGISLEDNIPDEKTVWLFKEHLINAKAIDKLFIKFNRYLEERGYKAECGSMVDASIIEVPKQRNNREDNKKIKSGEIPESWDGHTNKLRQKDVDARWTKKNNKNYYGYKNHINADTKYKLVRKYKVTPSSTHDGKCLKDLLDKKNTGNRLWADSAYRGDANERLLKEKGFLDRMQYKPKQGGWISNDRKRINHRRSVIRVRVEHIFGFIENSMNRKFIRSIGLKRAKWKIGMMNLVYNMCRYEQLLRLGTA